VRASFQAEAVAVQRLPNAPARVCPVSRVPMETVAPQRVGENSRKVNREMPRVSVAPPQHAELAGAT
jgi:hypothetical protein